MFNIINGGIYTRHPATFFMERKHGFDRYVLLIIKSESLLTIQERKWMISPNNALLITPHTPYSYYNPNGQYIDDWLHFECEKEDLSCFDEKSHNTPFALSNPVLLTTYFQQLLYENNYAPFQLRKSHTDNLFHIIADHLMYDFHNPAVTPYSPYLYPLQKLRMEMQAAPQNAGNAKEAADKIGISLSYFQHLYKKFFDISYQKDLIQMKISNAKELLRTTSLSVEQIAYSCGYSQPVHFFRQFQNITGMSPGRYRNTP